MRIEKCENECGCLDLSRFLQAWIRDSVVQDQDPDEQDQDCDTQKSQPRPRPRPNQTFHSIGMTSV